MKRKKKASGSVESKKSPNQSSPRKRKIQTAPKVSEDALSGEVAIRAKLDASGLDAHTKSRTVAAIDRLFGGLIGWPASYFEGKRARSEARNKILLDAISAEQPPAKIVNRVLADETRKQENLEEVWSHSEKLLLESPLIESTDMADSAEKLEDDWMNIFVAYAEKASSERLRGLWGRILSGEIRKPGSFSPTSLRLISEIDAQIATTFQEIAEFRLDGTSLRLPGQLLLKPNPLENDLLAKWTFLEEIGLLQEVNGNVAFNATLGNQGDSLNILSGGAYLKVICKQPAKLSCPVVFITRAGEQIASILPRNDMEALRRLGSSIKEDFTLELGIVLKREGGLFWSQAIEIIKP